MMTEDDASTNRTIQILRELGAALWEPPWPRLLVIAVLVIIGIAWTTYVGLRLQVTYTLETQQAQEQARLNDLIAKYQSDQVTLEQHITELEQTLYGTIEPSVQQNAAAMKVIPRRPSTPELWQRNRDAELRKILVDLQRRVNRIENEMR